MSIATRGGESPVRSTSMRGKGDEDGRVGVVGRGAGAAGAAVGRGGVGGGSEEKSMTGPVRDRGAFAVRCQKRQELCKIPK